MVISVQTFGWVRSPTKLLPLIRVRKSVTHIHIIINGPHDHRSLIFPTGFLFFFFTIVIKIYYTLLFVIPFRGVT